MPDLNVLDDLAIAPSLEGFSFSKDAFNFETSLFIGGPGTDDDDDGVGEPFGDVGGGNLAPMDVDGGDNTAPPGDIEDFFVGDQAAGDDYGNGEFEMGPDDQHGMGGGDGPIDDGDGTQPRTGVFEPFDPRRVPNERDLILAMTEPGANGSSLDYFDQTFLKNWAGPEHWKLRKVVRRRTSFF